MTNPPAQPDRDDDAGAADDDGDALTPAVVAANEFEARNKIAILDDAGIEAFVFDGERSWLGGAQNRLAGPGVPVMVRAADAERARAILQQTIEDSVDIDWSEVDVGENDTHPLSRPSPRAERRKGLMFFIAAVGVIIGVWLVLQLWTNP